MHINVAKNLLSFERPTRENSCLNIIASGEGPYIVKPCSNIFTFLLTFTSKFGAGDLSMLLHAFKFWLQIIYDLY
jgi:hypothetical protein